MEATRTQSRSEWKSQWQVQGVTCSDCAVTLEKGIRRIDGVESVDLNLGRGLLTVVHAQPHIDEDVHAVAREAGVRLTDLSLTRHEVENREASPVDSEPPSQEHRHAHTPAEGPWYRQPETLATGLSGVFVLTAILLTLFGFGEPWGTIAYVSAMLTGGWYVARSAWLALRVGHIDINLLTTLAVIGAAFLGEWLEGALVIFLFSVGETLESWSLDRTRNAIRSLMDLAPRKARVTTAEGEEWLAVEDVSIGTIVIVKPGERIPLDGRVTKGESSVNQAPITGESMPVEKGVGDDVFAGTLNERGYLEFEVTQKSEDTTLAKIMQMVEEAQDRRAPAQRFIDVFSRYYTPAIFALGVIVAAVPPLFFGAPFEPWLYKGLTVLLVACPCALVLSTPIAVVSGVGNAARNGVLLKGGVYLERAGKVEAVALDKTGTLTLGKPKVQTVLPVGADSENEVLAAAAAVEKASEHPLGLAILDEAEERGLQVEPGTDFEALTGKGARGIVQGSPVVVGSQTFFEQQGLLPADTKGKVQALQGAGHTVVLVSRDGQILGLIAISDPVRPEAREAIQGLHNAGIRHIAMLTGDNRRTAEAVARQVGLDDVKAELLPAHKLAAIEELRRKYGTVAMIGDGVNDAPALAAADLGIAMGAAGSDTAIETADIALMSDDLTKVAYAIELSRRTIGKIKQNIAFALGTKALAMLLIFPGIVTLWMAVLVDTGASLLVSANGMALLRGRVGSKRPDDS